jgi:myo-inositol-1(or 4)-monophosphatase
MSPAELIALFERIAVAIRDALLPIHGPARRARTAKPGQYSIDLVADAVALRHLRATGIAVLSEESGRTGPARAPITVVFDPVDGSSNAARHIPYWGTSLCALDGDGPIAALVVNQATGSTFRATRGGGAWRDGSLVTASSVTSVAESFVAFSGLPDRPLPWKQCRILGSAALALCDVACGAFDAFVDAAPWHAPWDYLGGLLVAREAGATVRDAAGRPLETVDAGARRQLFAGATPALLDELSPVVAVR